MTSLPTTHRPSDSFSPRAGVHAHVLGVKLSSTGPFLFKQERVGYGEKPFKIYKIRTTVIGPEAQGVGVIICLGLVALPLWVAAIYRLGALGSRHRSAISSMIASASGGPSISTASGSKASSASRRLRAHPGPWWRIPKPRTSAMAARLRPCTRDRSPSSRRVL